MGDFRPVSTDSGRNRSIRIRVFVDFWNFQLSINSLDRNYRIDWEKLGPIIAEETRNIVDPTASLAYQGMNVYGSYDPSNRKDDGLRHWALNTLNRFPGVQVTMLERQRKREGPVCPSCHTAILNCPECGKDMRGTEEKGVDTRIVTDMVRLAWIDDYEVAVLLSSDRDFVPVVEFLGTRGIKTVHGAFRHQGAILTQACWANFQVPQLMERFRRV